MKYLYFLSTLIFITNYSFGQLIFENNTSEDIYVVIQYPKENEWITSGWYKFTPGEERNVLNNLTNRYYYYYVTSDSKIWSGTDSYSWIHPTNAFYTSNKEIYTAAQGYKKVGLKIIDRGSNEKYTVSIERHYIFLGDKKYECTKAISFPCSNSLEDFDLIFTNNKDGSSYLVFQSIGPFSEFLTGNITLFLDDESTIKLFDKNIRDSYNERSGNWDIKKKYSVYYLTSSEVNRIKKSNIASMRYNDNYDYQWVYNKACGYNQQFGKGWRHEERVQFNSILSDLHN